MSLTLTDWYLARLAEAEAEQWPDYSTLPPSGWPERRAAEIRIKRAIVNLHARVPARHIGEFGCQICDNDPDCGMVEGNDQWCLTVRILATEFAAEPGYQKEWEE